MRDASAAPDAMLLASIINFYVACMQQFRHTRLGHVNRKYTNAISVCDKWSSRVLINRTILMKSEFSSGLYNRLINIAFFTYEKK